MRPHAPTPEPGPYPCACLLCVASPFSALRPDASIGNLSILTSGDLSRFGTRYLQRSVHLSQLSCHHSLAQIPFLLSPLLAWLSLLVLATIRHWAGCPFLRRMSAHPDIKTTYFGGITHQPAGQLPSGAAL